jgi:DNA-binding transcriptional MocR family regulator
MWTPRSLSAVGPRYLALADVIERDVRGGALAPGDRLPPQRAVADRLGLDLTTVTRAYAEARRRGLISGQVGRGTFVLASAPAGAPPSDSPGGGVVDLSLNVPPAAVTALAGEAMARTLAALDGGRLEALAGYQPNAGRPEHREAGAAWLVRRGLAATAGRVTVCSGSQHALTVLLLTLLEPGDAVMAESLTYPAFRALAGMLRLRLRGLEMDGEGVLPGAFRAACREGCRALYTVPTYQNPTAAVMGEARRREIAAIAREHGAAIIEDDVYGVMAPDSPPPLAALAPELGWFVSGMSKAVAPGLRIAYLLAPDAALADRMGVGVGLTTWMAPPLMAEVAAAWIGDGTAARLLDQARRESAARQKLAARVLSGYSFRAAPESYHLWLPLPRPWSAADFVVRARSRGLALAPADAFAVGPDAPAAVRVSLSGPRDLRELERALGIVRELLEHGPGPGRPML